METQLSRRDFLKSTSKALGLATILTLSGCFTTPMIDLPRFPLKEISQIQYLGMEEQEKQYHQINPRNLTSEQATSLRHFEIIEEYPKDNTSPLFSQKDINKIKQKYSFIEDPSSLNQRDKVFLMDNYIRLKLGDHQYFLSKPITK